MKPRRGAPVRHGDGGAPLVQPAVVGEGDRVPSVVSPTIVFRRNLPAAPPPPPPLAFG